MSDLRVLGHRVSMVGQQRRRLCIYYKMGPPKIVSLVIHELMIDQEVEDCPGIPEEILYKSVADRFH